MSERIFIGVAWPYANGPLHLGHVAGAYLPADIFARYHRMKGNQVLMVSGSDTHGTPITIKAEQEGKTPAEVAGFFHNKFLDSWRRLGISFDLFTSTETPHHYRVSQAIFLKLLENGYIYTAIVSQAYCPQCQRFMPDRYLEGICPHCKFTGARGDQCDACGKPLNADELVEPRCRLCGTTPVFKNSEHFFLKLSAFADRLRDWVGKQAHWRQAVLNNTLRYLNEGLQDRAITRDIEWGIPVPVKGFEAKRLYVWFEAVIGYLSASQEWAQQQGDPDKWQQFWKGDVKSYYFIGKDNIPFHTLIWPAMLMGSDSLNLPYDVPANEFLTVEGKKISTSRNWAIWLPDYLDKFDPDPLRYVLSINMPDTGDTDFSWREFVRRNNDELVATYGNLVNRVLTLVYNNFNGSVPEPGQMDDLDRSINGLAEDTLRKIDGLLYRCNFREAIRLAMSLAQEANRYLDRKAPWKVIKQDHQAAATSLFVALTAISALKTALYPFLPFSSQKVHEFLGFPGGVESGAWALHRLTPGQPLVKPQPLFTKLDDAVTEEQVSQMGQAYRVS